MQDIKVDFFARFFVVSKFTSKLTDISHYQALLDRLDKEVARAERDNDLIYHKDVPSIAALPAVGRSAIAKSTIPVELQAPKNAISGQKVVFEDLLGWGARTAIGMYFCLSWKKPIIDPDILDGAEIYQERRKDYIKDEIKGRAQEFDDQANV